MPRFFKMSCAVAIFLLASAAPFFAQTVTQEKSEPRRIVSTEVSSSPAFAELLLRKTGLRSELESLLLEYTEEYPRLKELRFVLTLLDRDIGRIAKVKPGEGSKLTLALGQLMIRRIELETDVWKLQTSYQDAHPEVKRAKRKVEVYEKAISQILD